MANEREKYSLDDLSIDELCKLVASAVEGIREVHGRGHLSEQAARERLTRGLAVIHDLPGKVNRRRQALKLIDAMVNSGDTRVQKVHAICAVPAVLHTELDLPGASLGTVGGQWPQRAQELAVDIIEVWNSTNKSKWKAVNELLAIWDLGTVRDSELAQEWQKAKKLPW